MPYDPTERVAHHIKYRARSPEQKREIIEEIYRMWLANPTMRLMQLIGNCHRGEAAFYYTEDYDLLAILKDRYDD